MLAKRDRYKKQGKDLLQTLAQQISTSLNGGNIGWHVNDQYKSVTEDWMKNNYDDGFIEW